MDHIDELGAAQAKTSAAPAVRSSAIYFSGCQQAAQHHHPHQKNQCSQCIS
jgi:hypothetical protein